MAIGYAINSTFMRRMQLLRSTGTRIGMHLSFWGAWLILWTNILSHDRDLWVALYEAACLAGVYAVFVYLNLRLGIPRLLWSGRYLAYGLFLLLIIPTCAAAIWTLYIWMGPGLAPDETGNAQAYAVAVVNSVFMIFLTSSLKLVLHSLNQQQLNRQLENQQLQTELNFLKSQVNPHFLFNTLNNLYSLALTKDDRAPEIVLKLSAILRYMLYECNERMVYLNKEISYLENYIELEELRQQGNKSIELRVSGNPDRKMIAPLLFTPLLENAIKHGLNRSTEQGWVNIEIDIRGMDLHVHMINSKGPLRTRAGKNQAMPQQEEVQSANSGTGTAAAPRSGGIGLINVKRRLDLVYPNRHSFSITDGPETYAVDLHLTLTE